MNLFEYAKMLISPSKEDRQVMSKLIDPQHRSDYNHPNIKLGLPENLYPDLFERLGCREPFNASTAYEVGVFTQSLSGELVLQPVGASGPQGCDWTQGWDWIASRTAGASVVCNGRTPLFCPTCAWTHTAPRMTHR